MQYTMQGNECVCAVHDAGDGRVCHRGWACVPQGMGVCPVHDAGDGHVCSTRWVCVQYMMQCLSVLTAAPPFLRSLRAGVPSGATTSQLGEEAE